MSYQIVSEEDGPDYEIHTCDRCGRTTMLSGVGGDVACCPCEFEGEDDVSPMTEQEKQEAEIQQERFEMEQEDIQLWDCDSGE